MLIIPEIFQMLIPMINPSNIQVYREDKKGKYYLPPTIQKKYGKRFKKIFKKFNYYANKELRGAYNPKTFVFRGKFYVDNKTFIYYRYKTKSLDTYLKTDTLEIVFDDVMIILYANSSKFDVINIKGYNKIRLAKRLSWIDDIEKGFS